MALSMETFERFFGGSRRKERAAQEELPIIYPQLQPAQPLFPSPSFIRPTSKSMKPREEESRTRNLEERETAYSLNSRGRSRRTSTFLPTTRGRQHHTAPTGNTQYPLEDSRSPSPPSFPEDSIFKNVSTTRYSATIGPVVDPMDMVSEEESENSDQDEMREALPRAQLEVYQPTGCKSKQYRPSNIQTTGMTADTASLLPSPIIMPSPISPQAAANALTLFESMPASPIKSFFANKTQSAPLLPRLNRFSTLNLPHLESPSASDSEEDFSGELGHFPSPASLPTPSTWSARESFDSLMDSMDLPTSPARPFRETWCRRANDPRQTQSLESLIPVRSPKGPWPDASAATDLDDGPKLWEPSLDDFLTLEDDDVADDYETASDNLYKAPTPPPKDTPKIPSSHCSQSCTAGIQKSASDCTVRPSYTKQLLSPQSTLSRRSRPLHASSLITTIANTYSFDQVYIMSFWPDDRKRLGRLLGFPTKSHIDRTDSPANHKPKVTGRLLASYGIADTIASWDLPTDILADALDTKGCWYEYEDPDAGPQGLSQGFMCSFYGNRLPSTQSLGDYACNRGIVFAAFHTHSQPIITSASPLDKKEFLSDLRSRAKLLVDETIKSLGECLQ